MTKKDKLKAEIEATRLFLQMMGEQPNEDFLNPVLERFSQALKELEEIEKEENNQKGGE